MRSPIGLPMAPSATRDLASFERRVMGHALTDAKGEAGVLGGLAHLDGLFDGVGHGLLHRDVLARLQGGEDVRVVQVRRGEHLDGVDVGVCEELVDVVVDPRHAPALCGGRGGRRHDVAHSEDLAARVLEIAGHVQIGDVAGTEHSDSNAVHDVGGLQCRRGGADDSHHPP